MSKTLENSFRITLYKSRFLNSESSTIPSYKLSFELNSISSETDKISAREIDFGSKVFLIFLILFLKCFFFEISKAANKQSLSIFANNTSWLAFNSTLCQISIPLNLSKLNDQRQWFYLKNNNDENVIAILTSLYWEYNDQNHHNHHLNNTKAYGNQRAELSCENLQSNLINTLLNRTMTINVNNFNGIRNPKENGINQCISATKINDNGDTDFIRGSCDYTSDRTLRQEEKYGIKIKCPSPSSNSRIPSSGNVNCNNNIHINTSHLSHYNHIHNNNQQILNHPCSTNNNISQHNNYFYPIYTDRKVSFSLKELYNNDKDNSNGVLDTIEAILNNSINYNSNDCFNHNEFFQHLTQKIRRFNQKDEYLNSQSNNNNQINDKLKERENILKRERNKLEEKCRKYKCQQGVFETKSLNLAQNNLQFANDQFHFMLEKEIFQHDKENYINMNLLLSHDLHMPISSIESNNNENNKDKGENDQCDNYAFSLPRKSINNKNMGTTKKKKDIMLENASNYKIKEYKSKPNSHGSATNYTSGNNSDTMSNDYQTFTNSNVQMQQDLSITLNNNNNNKYIAPIAEINLSNKQQEKTQIYNNNNNNRLVITESNTINPYPLTDSLEVGSNIKKVLPNNIIGRSALRKNSKQCVNNALSINNGINPINTYQPRKKSIKINTNRKITIIASNANAGKGDKNGSSGVLIRNNGISNTITPVSNSNIKNGIKINKKFK